MSEGGGLITGYCRSVAPQGGGIEAVYTVYSEPVELAPWPCRQEQKPPPRTNRKVPKGTVNAGSHLILNIKCRKLISYTIKYVVKYEIIYL